MSLLLLFGGVGATSITPLATDNELFLLMPDEIAAGVPSRIWAEMSDNVAASAPTSAIQLRIFSLDSSGNRSTAVPLHNMNSLGEAYYYDWTPTASGTYIVTVATHDGGKHLFKQSHITVRARFDPIALALHDTLVSRF
jgi:hypothetical protein